MPKFNGLNLKEWKNCDANTDSLWRFINQENLKIQALSGDYYIFCV